VFRGGFGAIARMRDEMDARLGRSASRPSPTYGAAWPDGHPEGKLQRIQYVKALTGIN
jgi:hypothetical protein